MLCGNIRALTANHELGAIIHILNDSFIVFAICKICIDLT